MVTNNMTVYQFEVGLDEVFADEVRFQLRVESIAIVNIVIIIIHNITHNNNLCITTCTGLTLE